MNIAEIREKYPQYKSIPDQELANKLHKKFYPDMDFKDFSGRIGLNAQDEIDQSMEQNSSRELSSQEIDISNVPEFGTVDGNKALFGSQFGDDNTGTGQLIRDAAAQLFTLNPKSRLDGLKKRFPELEVKEIGDDNAIIRNPQNGAITVLNSKGLSNQDLAPFIGSVLAFTPAGKAIQVPATVAGKVAAGALATGATDLALQGTEKLQGSDQDVDLVRAGISTTLGGVLPGLPSVAKAISEKSGISKLLKDAVPTIDNLKGAASSIYKEIDELGVVLKPKYVEKISNSLKGLASESGYHPKLHPKVAVALKEFEKSSSSPKSLSEIDNLRRLMNSAANSLEPDEKRVASILRDKMDDALDVLPVKATTQGNISTVSQKYKEARKLWSAARKSEVLEEAVNKAQNQASGFENGIRTQFRSIINNKKLRKSFSPSEVAAMQKVVRGGKAENIFKALGRFGFTEGQATQMLMGSVGVAAGSAIGGVPGAVAVPLVGQVSKTLAQRLTRNNAALADRVIRAGADAKQIAKAYFRATPKNQRSAEELSELLMLRGAKLSNIMEGSKRLPATTKQILEDATLMATGENLSSGLQ